MFNIAEQYSFSLDKDLEKSLRLFLLLHTLETYVNGAIIEMRRLRRERTAIKQEMEDALKKNTSRRKSFGLTYLAVDTHFYFICIDKVYKLLLGLAEELSDGDIKILADELNDVFDIKKVRNHLEHIDERCFGFLSQSDKQKGARTHIHDFANFVGDNFSFHGDRFPTSPNSLVKLKKVYIDLIDILHRKYASQDEYFVFQQQQRQQMKLIDAMVSKITQDLKEAGFFQN